MNFIDKTIGYFAPETALRRRTARSALEVLAKWGAYRGAKKSRTKEGWASIKSSANATLEFELADLRDRSREQVRNNPYAAKAVRSIACSLIGTGIMPRFKNDPDGKIAAVWEQFAEECDYDGHTDFYGLQNLAARCKTESGEVLIIKRRAKSGDGLKIPFQLQVLEPDHLDDRKNEQELPSGGYIVQGVEFNSAGKRVAYWLFPRHPGDLGRLPQSERIPAGEVFHLYEKLRPEQARGVPAMAPVLLKMKDLGDYEEAELFSKQIQACFTAFITKQNPDDGTYSGNPDQVSTDSTTNEKVEKFRPAMIHYLNPGEDVEFGSPSISQGYSDFVTAQLRAIATGLGTTYENLTGDLSQVNYSSFRAGLIDFRGYNEHQRWHLWIPGLCKPVMREFVNYAKVVKAISKDADVQVEWTPPRYESVDPMRDVLAAKAAVRSGFMSPQEAIAENGFDFRRVLDEREEFNKLCDQKGIVLDSDPRKITNSGVTQNDNTGYNNGQN